MPELPEVENVRKSLLTLVKDRVIENVQVFWPRLIDTDQDLMAWTSLLKGQVIEDVLRRGKYLVFELSDYYLVSHLRMEGKYLFFENGITKRLNNKHTHVIFDFLDGSQLHYNDVRKFGRFQLMNKNDLQTFFVERKLGPEPIEKEFDLSKFVRQLSAITKPIKTALLEQKLVVGLGNIYVDEVLFKARIHPGRQAKSLSKKEIVNLHQIIIEVLAQAIQAGGSTIRTYKNSLGEDGNYQHYLLVYGKNGQPCPNCGLEIKKIKLGGRGTHFCSNCQKE